MSTLQTLLDAGEATRGLSVTARGGQLIVGRMDEYGADPRFRLTPLGAAAYGLSLYRSKRWEPLPFEGTLDELADTMNHELAALGRRLVLILYPTSSASLLTGIQTYGTVHLAATTGASVRPLNAERCRVRPSSQARRQLQNGREVQYKAGQEWLSADGHRREQALNCLSRAVHVHRSSLRIDEPAKLGAISNEFAQPSLQCR